MYLKKFNDLNIKYLSKIHVIEELKLSHLKEKEEANHKLDILSIIMKNKLIKCAETICCKDIEITKIKCNFSKKIWYMVEISDVICV